MCKGWRGHTRLGTAGIYQPEWRYFDMLTHLDNHASAHQVSNSPAWAQVWGVSLSAYQKLAGTREKFRFWALHPGSDAVITGRSGNMDFNEIPY